MGGALHGLPSVTPPCGHFYWVGGTAAYPPLLGGCTLHRFLQRLAPAPESHRRASCSQRPRSTWAARPVGGGRGVQTVITLTSISLLISLSMTSLSLSSARGFGTVRWLCWFCSCWPCWRRGASCASSWRRGWQLG